jgi:Zn-finger nucleic acid-binding protein
MRRHYRWAARPSHRLAAIEASFGRGSTVVDSASAIRHPLGMRQLVACASCARQLDAGSLAPGESFHCVCGAALEVPHAHAHDAAVVRCSACGAARQEGTPSCGFCRADFTLHEQDLHTVCPGCLARVSDRGRYCHHCGLAILPAGRAGEASAYSCPVCGEARLLRSRSLGEPPVSVLECAGCAGLWLGRETFEVLAARARASAPAEVAGSAEPTAPPSASAAVAAGPAYRGCPVCAKLMHRRNYGRKSGVLIDSCRSHGLWFDAQELEAILRWVRGGGEASARRRDQEEDRVKSRQERLARELEPLDEDWRTGYGRSTLLTLGDVLASLFDR